MSLEALKILAPPPSEPVAAGTYAQWEHVEESLGLALPEDYKRFINAYGNGGFYKSLSIISPFGRDNSLDSHGNLLRWIKSGSEEYSSMKASFGRHNPEKFPFAAYPELGGLLAIGGIETGGIIYYRTQGQPSQWTIVIYDEEFYEFAECQATLTEFLIEWLEGRFYPPFFFDDVLERDGPPFSHA